MKLTSVIAYLRTVMREPSRQIQAYLAALQQWTKAAVKVVESQLERLPHLDKWFVDIACPSSATFFQREGAEYA